jgi:hypothetical protein
MTDHARTHRGKAVTPFHRGQHVQLSRAGIKARLQGRATSIKGLVMSVQDWPDAIRVRRDGRRSADTYHPSFWEPQR